MFGKNKAKKPSKPHISTGHGKVNRRYIPESVVKQARTKKGTKVAVKGKHGTVTKTLKGRNIRKDRKGHYFEYYDRSDTKKPAIRDYGKDKARHAEHKLNKKKGGYSGD